MADTVDSNAPEPASGEPYRVLARKYRPSHFGELIGQEPMVRTLRNAFAANRIPQAWMLTGVRGVGKTTTARILARALNYETDAGDTAPTVDFDTPGIHCQAIMEGRHVDVIEMDAASHTGINDIREITDAARYKPVSARYKVYIIDEVHMLSTAAFNGLLKTLEEPPEHVKFIFATTEIRKVPVTVLSRCQRFDLRRIDTQVLADHLANIAERENIAASRDALTMIARAAEGSVRDSLSLLDQAIAHGAGHVEADDLKRMLGLADRTRVIALFEAVAKGDAGAALAELEDQYSGGADPFVVVSELASFTHEVTRVKVTGAGPEPGEAPAFAERQAALAQTLGIGALSRLWQALLTGLTEIQFAAKPLQAAEMLLIRLAYMASLPEPGAPSGDRGSATETPGAAPNAARGAPQTGAPTASARVAATAKGQAKAPAKGGAPAMPTSFEQVAALVATESVKLRHAVERDMRLKRFEPGRIEVTLSPSADRDIVGELGKLLTELTGQRWIVSVSDGATSETLHESYLAEQAVLKEEVRKDPVVRALFKAFNDLEITEVRKNPAPEDDKTESDRAGDRESRR